MNTSTRPGHTAAEPLDHDHLPTAALLVMALMGFVLIASETMPAGLLPQIASGMGVPEATAGQFVSAYAMGTVLAAIPATALTRGLRRKPVAFVGLLGILMANVVTTLSSDIVLTLAVRMVAGACSGLLWGLLAGYARRISPSRHAGRALAIASIGVPAGLALGTPFGSWLGSAMGWRYAFVALAILSVITVLLTLVVVPDAPGQLAASRIPVREVIAIPGVGLILIVILTWMLAHNTFYTYIASYLSFADVGLSTQAALVTFGVAAVAGVWITGTLIDRALRALVLTSIGSFVVTGVVLVVGHQYLAAVLIAIVVWGVAFGGAATQLQTAMAVASGENADVANSLVGVAFNLAIFAGGFSGGLLISHYSSSGPGGDGGARAGRPRLRTRRSSLGISGAAALRSVDSDGRQARPRLPNRCTAGPNSGRMRACPPRSTINPSLSRRVASNSLPHTSILRGAARRRRPAGRITSRSSAATWSGPFSSIRSSSNFR